MRKLLAGCLLLLFSCTPLSNHLDDKILQCGPETDSLDRESLLRPETENWQGLVQTAEGYHVLPRTSRDCAILPAEGAVFMRDGKRPEGLSLQGFQLKQAGPLGRTFSTRVETLVPSTYTLSCGAAESQGFTVPYARQIQPASLLHLYELRYSLLQKEQVLAEGRQLIDGQGPALRLPSVLAEGSYRLRFSLMEVFDATLQNVPASEIECPLLIDRTAPEVKGFVEQLGKVGDQDLQEVAPGQALNPILTDAGAATLYYCLTIDDQPCETFQPLNGSIYMPEQGIVRITYYTRDASGNESPRQTLPPLAVMHRESMQAIDRGLSLARLEAARGSQLEADRLLLDAYQAFYRLTLPMEREPLRRKLAASYSEIGRAHFLRSSWSDHRSAVTRLQIDAGGITTVDSEGTLFQRSEAGILLQKEEQVVDQAADLRIFRDGRFQLGQRSGVLPISGIQKMHYAAGRLLVSHGNRVSFLQDTGSNWRLLWTLPTSDTVEALAFGETGVLLVVGRSLRVWQYTDGLEIKTFPWHPYCRFTQWHDTSRGSFIGLKTSIPSGVTPDGPFHCELLQWDEIHPPVPLDAAGIMSASFEFDPTLFRFEEVEVMAWDPGRQWLYISRNLDGRLIVYDLRRNQAEIYDEGFPSEPTAIGLSADGKRLGIAWGGAGLLSTWNLPADADALQFPLAEANFQIRNLPRTIRQVGFSANPRTVWTLDEGQDLRSYAVDDALIPILRNELRETWRGETSLDAILRWVGDEVLLSDAYGGTRGVYPLPSGSRPLRLVLTEDSIYLLDTAARLYQHSLIGGDWMQLYQGQAPVRDLVLSPTRQHALILATGRTELLTRDAHGFYQSALIPKGGEIAAWNKEETLFALASGQDQSLWTTKGRGLVEQAPARNAVPIGLPYQPFSADGKSWIVRQDQTVTVFDAVQETWSAPLTLSARPGLVRFTAGSKDRLLLAENRSSGGQLLVERKLQGTITADFGTIPGSLRQVLSPELAISANGRVLAWNAGVVETLIAESAAVNGLLQEYQSPTGVLVVDVQYQAVSFLYLKDDVRQMQRLCDWLRPSLTAARDGKSQELLRQCR